MESLKHLSASLLPGVVAASVFILGVRIGKRRKSEPEIQFIPTNEIPFYEVQSPSDQVSG